MLRQLLGRRRSPDGDLQASEKSFRIMSNLPSGCKGKGSWSWRFEFELEPTQNLILESKIDRKSWIFSVKIEKIKEKSRILKLWKCDFVKEMLDFSLSTSLNPAKSASKDPKKWLSERLGKYKLIRRLKESGAYWKTWSRPKLRCRQRPYSRWEGPFGHLVLHSIDPFAGSPKHLRRRHWVILLDL